MKATCNTSRSGLVNINVVDGDIFGHSEDTLPRSGFN